MVARWFANRILIIATHPTTFPIHAECRASRTRGRCHHGREELADDVLRTLREGDRHPL